jgi:hypothetical protein
MTDTVHPRHTPTNQPQSGHPHANALRPGAGQAGGARGGSRTGGLDGGVPGRRSVVGRLVRGGGYGVALLVVGALAMVGSLAGRMDSVQRRWRRMAGYLGSAEPVRLRRPGAVNSFVHGVLSVVFGFLSLFLLMLFVLSIVRGPFYGFVEDGPFGPGTWGGPTKAGAWAVHAAVALPVILLIPFVLRGLALLHAAAIRRLYGSAVGWWVLPATILLSIGGLLFFYSWTQQI